MRLLSLEKVNMLLLLTVIIISSFAFTVHGETEYSEIQISRNNYKESGRENLREKLWLKYKKEAKSLNDDDDDDDIGNNEKFIKSISKKDFIHMMKFYEENIKSQICHNIDNEKYFESFMNVVFLLGCSIVNICVIIKVLEKE